MLLYYRLSCCECQMEHQLQDTSSSGTGSQTMIQPLTSKERCHSSPSKFLQETWKKLYGSSHYNEKPHFHLHILPVWISAAHITDKNFTELIHYVHRHIFSQSMVKQGRVQNWSTLPAHQNLLSQFGDFHNITAAINFSVLFPTHDGLFSCTLLAEDSLGAHDDNIGARGNAQSPRQLKAAILSLHRGLSMNVHPARLADIYESSWDDLGRCFGTFRVTKASDIPPTGYPPLCFRWYGNGYSAGVDGFSAGVGSSREREVPGLGCML